MLKFDGIEIICQNCGEKHYFSCNDFELNSKVSDLLPKGPEQEHRYCKVFDCKCGETIFANISLFEYPIFNHNFSEFICEGGTFSSVISVE